MIKISKLLLRNPDYYDWMGKVIHREMYKKSKFGHPNKCHMHNPESVLENEMCKSIWDFEIQTDHVIST